MRFFLALLGLGSIGYLAYHGSQTQEAAVLVLAKAESMYESAGEEAGEIGFRVVADRYPFSSSGIEARRRLYRIRTETLQTPAVAEDGPARADRVLGDSMAVQGDPYIGSWALASFAALLCLARLLRPRCGWKPLSFCVLVLLVLAMFATQTKLGLGWIAGVGSGVGETLYSHVVLGCGGIVLLGSVLLLLPSRPRRESAS